MNENDDKEFREFCAMHELTPDCGATLVFSDECVCICLTTDKRVFVGRQTDKEVCYQVTNPLAIGLALDGILNGFEEMHIKVLLAPLAIMEIIGKVKNSKE